MIESREKFGKIYYFQIYYYGIVYDFTEEYIPLESSDFEESDFVTFGDGFGD